MRAVGCDGPHAYAALYTNEYAPHADSYCLNPVQFDVWRGLRDDGLLKAGHGPPTDVMTVAEVRTRARL